MATAFTNFTQAQYDVKYGTNLSNIVPAVASGVDAVTLKIGEACEMILCYIEDNSPGFSRSTLETAQITNIQTAAMMQLKFLLDECNYANVSGYDAVKGTTAIIPHEISKDARKFLARRILFRGL